MRGLAQPASRRAGFTEEKRLAALTQSLKSSGMLVYRRPDYLEKRTLTPTPETLIINGSQLSLAIPGQQPRHVDLDSQPALRGMVDALRAPLAGDLFTLTHQFAVRTEGNAALWRMTLLPKQAEAARFVRQIALDGASGDITRIDILQGNGDEQIMTIRPSP
jgi:hypothetical protein